MKSISFIMVVVVMMVNSYHHHHHEHVARGTMILFSPYAMIYFMN